jgi:hypothetical protein
MFKKLFLMTATLALVSTGALAAEDSKTTYKGKMWKTVVSVNAMSDNSYCRVTSTKQRNVTANADTVYVNFKQNGIVNYQIRLDSEPALPKVDASRLERDTGFIMIPATSYVGKNRMRIVGQTIKGKTMFQDLNLATLALAVKACN